MHTSPWKAKGIYHPLPRGEDIYTSLRFFLSLSLGLRGYGEGRGFIINISPQASNLSFHSQRMDPPRDFYFWTNWFFSPSGDREEAGQKGDQKSFDKGRLNTSRRRGDAAYWLVRGGHGFFSRRCDLFNLPPPPLPSPRPCPPSSRGNCTFLKPLDL